MIGKYENQDWNLPIRTDDSSLHRNIPVLSRDLTGDVFHLAIDDGNEYLMEFVSDDLLQWGLQGEILETCHYLCVRANESVWMVSFTDSRQNCLSVVLDLENSLCTLVTAETGAFPKRPKLLRHEFLFGAIRLDGKPLTARRHCFTDDLTGRKIAWDYSPVETITHIYYTANSIRASLKNMRPLPPDATPEQTEKCRDRARRWGALFFEERARYIKIMNDLYLVAFIEANRNRIDPDTGGGDMVLLVDTKRVRDTGRGFSMGENGPAMKVFNCQGRFINENDEMEDVPSPYWI